MKKQEISQKKNKESYKKSYKKPLLIRYQKLTSITAGFVSGVPLLGCTRF